jgi:peroxiredoxin
VSLGRAYLDARSPALAAQAFEKALTLTRNDWFSLAGLVEAYHGLGQQEKAKTAMARLLFITSDADKGLKWLERATSTGVTAAPRDSSSAPQRKYSELALDRFGPNTWEPYEAPELDVRDHEDKPVRLANYKEKSIILVFYLGRECLHCMKQLQDINAKKSDWDRLETAVLVVSSNKPEDNARYIKDMAIPAARILSDRNFENARRFKSYDDFEEMELHSTILIDKKGRVHWARNGGAPFEDMAFLIKQIERMNRFVEAEAKPAR